MASVPSCEEEGKGQEAALGLAETGVKKRDLDIGGEEGLPDSGDALGSAPCVRAAAGPAAHATACGFSVDGRSAVVIGGAERAIYQYQVLPTSASDVCPN